MGLAELDTSHYQLNIHSHIIVYGTAADVEITERIRDEIETMWNEPATSIMLQSVSFQVIFRISAEMNQEINEFDVLQNDDPRNNYFRIENHSAINISFVDGVGCNSGYFLLENLYKGSTTAAHEYGHTIGLDHPRILDLRGKGVPGIMYPRGTLVDPPFQYEPSVPAGAKGGTMHPMYRKVLPEDIHQLKLHKLRFVNRRSIVGDFSNVYHLPHI